MRILKFSFQRLAGALIFTHTLVRAMQIRTAPAFVRVYGFVENEASNGIYKRGQNAYFPSKAHPKLTPTDDKGRIFWGEEGKWVFFSSLGDKSFVHTGAGFFSPRKKGWVRDGVTQNFAVYSCDSEGKWDHKTFSQEPIFPKSDGAGSDGTGSDMSLDFANLPPKSRDDEYGLRMTRWKAKLPKYIRVVHSSGTRQDADGIDGMYERKKGESAYLALKSRRVWRKSDNARYLKHSGKKFKPVDRTATISWVDGEWRLLPSHNQYYYRAVGLSSTSWIPSTGDGRSYKIVQPCTDQGEFKKVPEDFLAKAPKICRKMDEAQPQESARAQPRQDPDPREISVEDMSESIRIEGADAAVGNACDVDGLYDLNGKDIYQHEDGKARIVWANGRWKIEVLKDGEVDKSCNFVAKKNRGHPREIPSKGWNFYVSKGAGISMQDLSFAVKHTDLSETHGMEEHV